MTKPHLSTFSRNLKITLDDTDEPLDFLVPADLYEVLASSDLDMWLRILNSGAAVQLTLLDPLQETDFARRVAQSLEAHLYDPVQVTEASPHQVSLDRQARNIERLVRAYGVLSDKDVRVKLTCEGRLPRDTQEIYIDLPAEKA